MLKPAIAIGLVLMAAGVIWWTGWLDTDEIDRSVAAGQEAKGSSAARPIESDNMDADSTRSASSSVAPGVPGPTVNDEMLRDADASMGRGQVIVDERLRELRRQARHADRLAAEASLLSGESVSVPGMHAALTASDEEFDAIQSSLERQAFDDPLASELTDIYRQFMESGLDGEHGDFSMDRLTCGLRLCIGESGVDRALFEAALAQWQNGNGPPLYTVMELPVYDESGAFLGNRIIFSTDPENSAVEVPIGFQPPQSDNPSPPDGPAPDPGG